MKRLLNDLMTCEAMRKGGIIAVALLLTLLCAVVIWQALPAPEPVYQGKRLSQWLEGYDLSLSRDRLASEKAYNQADEAVRALGTNAIPTLLRLLTARDSWLKLKAAQLMGRQQFVRIPFTDSHAANLRALRGFAALGESASNAVPSLIQIYEQNRSVVSQGWVVRALGDIGPGASGAIPCLISAASATNFGLRLSGLHALAKVHARPELTIPVLANALRSDDWSVRDLGVLALEDLLAPWLSDFDSHLPEVRQGAADAVRQIGTNSLPVLIARIRHEEPRLKSELRNITEDDSPVTVSPDHTAQLCYQALAACDALGPLAKPAMPALEELLLRLPRDGTFDHLRAEMGTQLDAACVMVRISPDEALAVFQKALTNDVPAMRLCARTCLDLLQSRSPLFYPTNSSDPDFWSRSRHFRKLLIKDATTPP